MAMTPRASLEQKTQGPEESDPACCPPHHWMIVDRLEDGFREERWECRRCGDAKLIRTPAWAGNARRMSNTSTWTPEDKILGGDDDGDQT